jgi:hypothetical protein
VSVLEQPSSLWYRARRSGALVTSLITLLLGLAPAAARGDGDPASDVLLAQNAFYPYQPPAPPKLEATLNALLGAASREHMPLKVAIIGSREDLGAVSTFFGHPQKYAEFLDREISYNQPQPLLVVMPAGFGLVIAAPASALAHLTIDTHHGTYGLTRTAILAVTALARANGHTIVLRPIPPATSAAHGGLPTAVLFSLPVLLLIVAGIAIRRSGKRNPSRRTPSKSPPA